MQLVHNLRVPAHFGIRTERYKMIFFYGCTSTGDNKTPVAGELYDLKNDPSEMQNQYTNPEYAEVVAELKANLKKQCAELNETDAAYSEVQHIIETN